MLRPIIGQSVKEIKRDNGDVNRMRNPSGNPRVSGPALILEQWNLVPVEAAEDVVHESRSTAR